MEVDAQNLEDKTKNMAAIIEFPSEEAIQAMYHDPEYQSIIPLRHNSTSDCTMTIFKTLSP
jgi:uncharacterized protein (DUF1330 family)